MQYGHFSEDGREFIVDNVATPAPWINYIYNGRYFATVSNNGGGISYFGNPLHGRITRYRINDVPPDRPGKYIYVRDRDTKEVWSLTWQPVGRDREAYRVTHGFGYTKASAAVEDIASEVCFFVPPEDDVEIWKATLLNQSDRPRRLSLYAYVEFALGHGHVDLINQCDDQHFNRVHFDKQANSLFATKTYWITQHSGTQQQENQEWDRWAYFTANLPVQQYETVRERFIGPYRNENRPLGVETGELSCRDTDFGNTVGALRVDIELSPGESRDIVFCLGVIPKVEFADRKHSVPVKYHDVAEVDAAFLRVREQWDDYFQHIRVETPENDVNTFLNYWTPYQAKVAYDVGRVASFYYWGISRGFGFRDTSQDTIAVTATHPDKARERIQLLARQMFSTGKVYHHFHADGQGETTKHCDDPFWFILAVTDYVKETGDTAILRHEEPFVDKPSASILEHLMAVARFAGTNLGKHGLPIFGRGDWNDTLDFIGGDDGGESVWGGMFYVCMLNALIELLVFIGEEKYHAEVIGIRDPIAASINQHCWDGQWFIRAFGAKDRKIGSSSSEAGRIFLNAQSWAVLAEITERDRLLSAMDSVKEHLDSEFGPKICAPAYREIDPSIGLITRCVHGKKENGAVFCHPVTWCIMAECMLGRGEQAYHYYKKTLPNQVDSDVFYAEPYVYSQYITSDEHEGAGRASHSWQTGTAAWMKKVAIDYILGIRATYTGLRIDPTIPGHWQGFTVERVYRGTRYVIRVENPDGVESGIRSLQMDGRELDTNVVPIVEASECQVRAIMGAVE